MQKIFPRKLKKGDEIRVIASARSLSTLSEDLKNTAIQNLEKLGFTVTFSKNCEEIDLLSSSSIKSRVSDLHDAFLDKNVKAILTVIGGFNSNQLLPFIDYEIIKNNPKILCGYSDITALTNAITVKTGLVTYSGLHFSSFGKLTHIDYKFEYFEKCLSFESSKSFTVNNSKLWTDGEKTIENSGMQILKKGFAEGEIVGGNLCTLNLLQGTEFMPELENKILFLEDDYECQPENFDRDLQSLLQQKGGNKIKAIVFGRFQITSNMTNEKLQFIVDTKQELVNIPMLSNVDFGHTSPSITFPIGGTAKLRTGENTENIQLEIIKH